MKLPLALIVLFAFGTEALAQTPTCDALSGEKAERLPPRPSRPAARDACPCPHSNRPMISSKPPPGKDQAPGQFRVWTQAPAEVKHKNSQFPDAGGGRASVPSI